MNHSHRHTRNQAGHQGPGDPGAAPRDGSAYLGDARDQYRDARGDAGGFQRSSYSAYGSRQADDAATGASASSRYSSRVGSPEYRSRNANQRSIHPSKARNTLSPRSFKQKGGLLKGVLSVVSVIVLLASGVEYATVGRLGNDLATANNLVGHGNAADGATDILLVGTDSRSDAQGNPLSPDEVEKLHAGDDPSSGNTDTIMVIRVPNDGSSATAVSVPRDTYIHDSKHGNMKINGVYGAYKHDAEDEMNAKGEKDKDGEKARDAGRRGLINGISELTGITVDHYAEIGLVGFVLLTDAVGGVDVCLAAPSSDDYSGANFPSGRQTLDGGKALAFVRQRHGLPRGDLDRIVRQQAYMASLVHKVLSTGTLANPGKLQDISNAVERSVLIDSDWDVMRFANQMQDLVGGKVHFETIPVTSPDGVGDQGESVVTVDPKQVHKFFQNALGDKKDSSSETSASSGASASPGAGAASDTADKKKPIQILNASSVEGMAAETGGALEDKGYDVTQTSNAQSGLYSSSQVVAADANDPAAKQLAKDLGGLPISTSTSLSGSSLVVVTASDYKGPRKAEAATQKSTAVGVPGGELQEESPVLDAGGDGPRCVN